MIEETGKSRSPQGYDEAQAETTGRRSRSAAPAGSRALPGATQNLSDEAADSGTRARPSLKSRNTGRWWRPTSRWAQALLAFCSLILLASAALGVYWLKTFVLRDARFRIEGVRSIETAGLSEVSRDDLLPVFGEDVGRNIFFVPLTARRRQLEQIPWIERATVMRLLPGRLRISIVERHPVAFVLLGTTIGLVDADGVLLSMPAAELSRRHYSFPVVTGISAADQAPVRKGRMAVFHRLMAELDGSGHQYSSQISEIDLSNPDDLRVQLSEPGGEIVADFGEDRFLERFERYKEYIGGWRRLYPNLSAVDLRYDDRVYLKMGHEGAEQIVESGPAAPQPVSTPPAAHGTLEKAPPAAPAKAAAPLKAAAAVKAGSPHKPATPKTLKKPGAKTAPKPVKPVAKTAKPAARPALRAAKAVPPAEHKTAAVKPAALAPAAPASSRPAAWWQEQ